ncbi:hypothetical protein [Embleya hyalina]|uniref:Uncharacterized protein n=1 Tax=Embleya hyalina TaxID=516124 RepID=A0A401YMR9_9ACTN|nr:hypothetical protein [Embleya hyalina]GCD95910.1 hypothetical protein EHYA_03594 [Embleya hyalina]
MRVVLEHGGPKTVDSVVIRIGSGFAAVTVTPVADDITLPAATLERLTRRAADLLRSARDG